MQKEKIVRAALHQNELQIIVKLLNEEYKLNRSVDSPYVHAVRRLRKKLRRNVTDTLINYEHESVPNNVEPELGLHEPVAVITPEIETIHNSVPEPIEYQIPESKPEPTIENEPALHKMLKTKRWFCGNSDCRTLIYFGKDGTVCSYCGTMNRFYPDQVIVNCQGHVVDALNK